MALIYILLTVIAVGVLLLSQQGRMALSFGAIIFVCLAVIAFVGGFLLLLYLGASSIEDIEPSIILLLLFLGGVYYCAVNLSDWIRDVKEVWNERRTHFFVAVALLVIITCNFIFLFYLEPLMFPHPELENASTRNKLITLLQDQHTDSASLGISS